MSESNKPEKVKYKKIGGGSLRINGQIIKPNQTFYAYPHQLSAWENVVDCLEPDKLPENEHYEDVTRFKLEPKENQREYKDDEKIADKDEAMEKSDDEFDIKDRGRGWYDVVNVQSGKAINENALRIQEAKDLKATLEA